MTEKEYDLTTITGRDSYLKGINKKFQKMNKELFEGKVEKRVFPSLIAYQLISNFRPDEFTEITDELLEKDYAIDILGYYVRRIILCWEMREDLMPYLDALFFDQFKYKRKRRPPKKWVMEKYKEILDQVHTMLFHKK